MSEKKYKFSDGEIVELTPAEISKVNEREAIEAQRLSEIKYKLDRAAEYPSIEELVVALWEGVVEERMAAVTQLETLRQAVKAKYPKG